MSKKMKFPIELCYNCGKKETCPQGIADLEKVEVELEDDSIDEEMFMPLCPECNNKWKKGKLPKIENKWKTEENKGHYSSDIGQWTGDYGFTNIENKENRNIKKVNSKKMKIIQFDNREMKKRFFESNDSIAKLAEDEGCNYDDPCEQCDKELEVIISGGSANYYLCSEHFNQLKKALCGT